MHEFERVIFFLIIRRNRFVYFCFLFGSKTIVLALNDVHGYRRDCCEPDGAGKRDACSDKKFPETAATRLVRTSPVSD